MEFHAPRRVEGAGSERGAGGERLTGGEAWWRRRTPARTEDCLAGGRGGGALGRWATRRALLRPRPCPWHPDAATPCMLALRRFLSPLCCGVFWVSPWWTLPLPEFSFSPVLARRGAPSHKHLAMQGRGCAGPREGLCARLQQSEGRETVRLSRRASVCRVLRVAWALPRWLSFLGSGSRSVAGGGRAGRCACMCVRGSACLLLLCFSVSGQDVSARVCSCGGRRDMRGVARAQATARCSTTEKAKHAAEAQLGVTS